MNSEWVAIAKWCPECGTLHGKYQYCPKEKLEN